MIQRAVNLLVGGKSLRCSIRWDFWGQMSQEFDRNTSVLAPAQSPKNGLSGNWDFGLVKGAKKPVTGNPTFQELA
jgi:hypothetical protein